MAITGFNLPSNSTISGEVESGDTIKLAVQKLESQLINGTVPSGSLSGINMVPGAVSLSKISVNPLPSALDTFKTNEDVNQVPPVLSWGKGKSKWYKLLR